MSVVSICVSNVLIFVELIFIWDRLEHFQYTITIVAISQGGDKLTLNLGSIAQPAEAPTTANLIEVRVLKNNQMFGNI